MRAASKLILDARKGLYLAFTINLIIITTTIIIMVIIKTNKQTKRNKLLPV